MPSRDTIRSGRNGELVTRISRLDLRARRSSLLRSASTARPKYATGTQPDRLGRALRIAREQGRRWSASRLGDDNSRIEATAVIDAPSLSSSSRRPSITTSPPEGTGPTTEVITTRILGWSAPGESRCEADLKAFTSATLHLSTSRPLVFSRRPRTSRLRQQLSASSVTHLPW